MGRQNILEGEELTGLRAVHQNSDRIYQMFSLEKGEKNGLGFNGLHRIFWFSYRYGSIWATLGLPKKFTPWSFESFSHFFLDFSKKKAKIFEI